MSWREKKGGASYQEALAEVTTGGHARLPRWHWLEVRAFSRDWHDTALQMVEAEPGGARALVVVSEPGKTLHAWQPHEAELASQEWSIVEWEKDA